MLLNPRKERFASLDPRSREIMERTVAFFEEKGKARLKEDDRLGTWYRDFLDWNREVSAFATLLTPPEDAIGDPDARWDTYRNCVFNELLGFYGLSYWYAWQVTILGLGPIWMSANAAAREKTARKLREGGIFGFGLSEKAHGADLYSTEMMLTPMADGSYRADGGKYYIGNGNEAALLSIFGKSSETDEFAFFVVETDHPDYECVQNVVSSQMYVSELALRGYPVASEGILSMGQDAWDAALNTVNVGKFNLGWASVGICTHAFYEALDHAANRVLYGRHVTDFPHVRRLLTDAYARLVAMRLFSSRAIDYMRAASAEDRRYLLYNPLVKMKVTTQGEAVIDLLWDVIAARGFEKDTYFEMATRHIRALPKLEGTVHVNMALVVKFMKSFLFQPAQMPEVPRKDGPDHDAFLFDQGPARGLGNVRFHDPALAYDSVSTPNLDLFKRQIRRLKALLAKAPPEGAQTKDMDFLLSLGELFTLVAYGQLVIESCTMDAVDGRVLDQIFDFMVRDFSRYALELSQRPSVTDAQSELCLAMIERPARDAERAEWIWREHVLARVGAYEMRR